MQLTKKKIASSGPRLPDQIGSTFLLPKKQTSHDCIAKWKPSDFEISLTPSDSTAKTKAKARGSKAFPNILRSVLLSLSLSHDWSFIDVPRQIGTIVPTSTPFGQASTDNLPRASRKRTIVDELVDDAEARRYAKKKFEELQSVRSANGRGTWAKRLAMRKRKW